MKIVNGCVYWCEVSMHVDKNGDGYRTAEKIRIPVTCIDAKPDESIINYLNPASGKVEAKEVKNNLLFDTPLSSDFSDYRKKELRHIKTIGDQLEAIKRLDGEIARLKSLINNPLLEDFFEGVKNEAAHQTERWGIENEELKYPHDYSMVLDRLKGKQCDAVWNRDSEKYQHHLQTMAAVCFNAYRQVRKEGTLINMFFINPHAFKKKTPASEIVHGDNCNDFQTACKDCLDGYYKWKGEQKK